MESITVQISVQSDLNKVWEYWTNPNHITNWNFASDEWCCPRAVNDLKPNGKFMWRMEAKDGSMGFDFEGTYDEVIEKKWISYRMTDGRKVEIKFIQDGSGVSISETVDAEKINSAEQQRAGWQAILGNFKQYIESSENKHQA